MNFFSILTLLGGLAMFLYAGYGRWTCQSFRWEAGTDP